MSSSMSPLVVSLVGHSTNSDNLGVGALTVSQVDILRGIAQRTGLPLKIRVIDWQDPRPPYVGGPDIEIMRIRGRDFIDPRRVFAALWRSDLVIDIGAGDSFADIYGSKRLNRMFAVKYQAHLAGTPYVLAPQTIGPFTKPHSRALAKAHIRRCRAVFTRDALSSQALADMGVAEGALEVSDVALRLPYEAPAPRGEGAPLRVGLNPSGLLLNGGYTGKNMFGLKADYPALIDRIIRHFTAMPGVELHLVGHVISDIQPVEDDYRACEALAKAHPETVLAPRFDTPSEAKSYIAGMDFFLGARMHATIAAFSAGIPVVPMAYSRKFRGLFGTLGYDRVVECTSQENDAIFAAVAEAFEARAALAAEVQAALARGQEKMALYDETLTSILSAIAAKKRR